MGQGAGRHVPDLGGHASIHHPVQSGSDPAVAEQQHPHRQEPGVRVPAALAWYRSGD